MHSIFSPLFRGIPRLDTQRILKGSKKIKSSDVCVKYDVFVYCKGL